MYPKVVACNSWKLLLMTLQVEDTDAVGTPWGEWCRRQEWVQIDFSCHKGYSTGQNVLVMLAHIQNISPFCDRVTLTLCVAHGDRYLWQDFLVMKAIAFYHFHHQVMPARKQRSEKMLYLIFLLKLNSSSGIKSFRKTVSPLSCMTRLTRILPHWLPH